MRFADIDDGDSLTILKPVKFLAGVEEFGMIYVPITGIKGCPERETGGKIREWEWVTSLALIIGNPELFGFVLSQEKLLLNRNSVLRFFKDLDQA